MDTKKQPQQPAKHNPNQKEQQQKKQAPASKNPAQQKKW